MQCSWSSLSFFKNLQKIQVYFSFKELFQPSPLFLPGVYMHVLANRTETEAH